MIALTTPKRADTGTKKSDWRNCLKTFHKTRTKSERLRERIRLGYGSELQSKRIQQWLSAEGIILDPPAPYSQEENGVSERLGCTLMEIARVSIIEGGIDDSFWPKMILAITCIKNIRPTKAVQRLSPHQEIFKTLPNLAHLQVLGSTVYFLVQTEKFVPRAL